MSIVLEAHGEVIQVSKLPKGGYLAIITDDRPSFALEIAVGPLIDHVLMPYSKVKISVVIEEPFPDEDNMAEMMREQEEHRQARMRGAALEEREKADDEAVTEDNGG